MPAVPGEPEGWHTRERTDTGYWLMGSSPAERAEAVERGERCRQQAMRDHPFEGEGKYCQAWIELGSRGDERIGVITMRAGCGYPRDTHADQGRGD